METPALNHTLMSKCRNSRTHTMNYQIYTMFVNGKGLLVHALNSLSGAMDRVVVLDNSLDQSLILNGFTGEIHRPPVPLFCAQSYNLIAKLAQDRNQDVFFIMHSDAEASEQTVAEVLALAQELDRKEVRWGALFTSYDVLCLYNARVLKDFLWDNYLPVYYTDVDFYRRLRLAGIEIIETGLSVGHMNGGSSTMKNSLGLNHFIQANYPGWQRYYISKWGGDRGEETFATPFNIPSASLHH